MNKKSVSHETLLKAYLPPCQMKLVKGYSHANQVSNSAVVKQALKCFFEKITPAERERLLSISKNRY